MACSCSRRRRNRAPAPFPALLLGVTVVAISQVAWALPRAAAFAAEPPQADQGEPPSQSPDPAQPIGTPDKQRARADSGHDQGSNPRSYLLAVGGAVLTGGVGKGAALGLMEEGHVRVSVLPWLGIGISYLDMSAPNNDNRPPFGAQALALNASWHPLKYSSFDPFLQLGGVRLFNVSGDALYFGSPSPWSAEAQLGVNYVVPHFALGLQLRRAVGDYDWTMLGLQFEGRI